MMPRRDSARSWSKLKPILDISRWTTSSRLSILSIWLLSLKARKTLISQMKMSPTLAILIELRVQILSGPLHQYGPALWNNKKPSHSKVIASRALRWKWHMMKHHQESSKSAPLPKIREASSVVITFSWQIQKFITTRWSLSAATMNGPSKFQLKTHKSTLSIMVYRRIFFVKACKMSFSL